MPTLRHRIAFLRGASRVYLWRLLLRKLGKKRMVFERDGRRVVIPFGMQGGPQLAGMGEPWMEPLFRKLLPVAPGTFVDVGANVGATLAWLRILDPERPWIGIEPSPGACAFIRELIRVNDFRGATLIEAGLSDAPGKSVLYAAGVTDSSASMIADFSGKNSDRQDMRFEVELRSGAELADRELADRVGVLKIDVEGMELEVVRGLKPILQRDRPPLFFEVIPAQDDGSERFRRMRDRQAELTRELHALDYRIMQILAGAKLRDVGAPANDSDRDSWNYLGVPAERHEELTAILK